MSTDLIGQMLGPYQITEFVGNEGSAETYKGYDPERSIPVLVRLVGRGHPADPVWSARFRRETKTIAALKHANIAPILDVGEALDGHYMVSELIEGTTLADILSEIRAGTRTMQPDDLTFMVRQIAAGLDEAHAKGAVHRDVNPHRILITRSGHAILTDFGLAMLLSRDAEEQSSGAPFGMPEYMAPEVHLDLRQASPASDIYSIGAILYEVVTGIPPSTNGSAPETLDGDQPNGELDPPLMNKNVVPTVAHTIKTALAVAPKDRFRNTMHLAEQLEWAYHNPTADVNRSRKRAKTAEPSAADTSLSEAAAAGVVVKRGPTLMDERREKARRRAEHRKKENEERKAAQSVRRQEQAEARRQFFGKWGRTFIALVLFGGAIVGIVYGLSYFGILNVSVVVPTVDVAVQIPFVTPSVPFVDEVTTEPPQVVTEVSTPDSTVTEPPIEVVTEVPTPPVVLTPLLVGSSAYRAADGGIMQFVPAGVFQMGTNDTNFSQNARPQHTVSLSAYWIDQTEVTNVQYAMCVAGGVCTEPTKLVYYANPEYAKFPATFVDHGQATSYCLWLATQTGQLVGLPTEAQWEKSAAWNPETNTQSFYPWGSAPPNNDLARYVFSPDGRPASRVGSHPLGASAYGALDLAGNVWEWAADWFDPAYYQREGVAQDPTGPISGVDRVTRGGSWRVEPELLVVLKRNPARPDISGDSLGFRCVLTAEYPPIESGIVLTPLDATRKLTDMVEQTAIIDAAIRDEWLSAFMDLRTALETGNNAAARQIVDVRLEQLSIQGATSQFADTLAWQLERGLLWMQSQLPETVEAVSTEAPALDITPLVTPSTSP